jgi:hypothetical protein
MKRFQPPTLTSPSAKTSMVLRQNFQELTGSKPERKASLI